MMTNPSAADKGLRRILKVAGYFIQTNYIKGSGSVLSSIVDRHAQDFDPLGAPAAYGQPLTGQYMSELAARWIEGKNSQTPELY
jgi:hypothetical protein